MNYVGIHVYIYLDIAVMYRYIHVWNRDRIPIRHCLIIICTAIPNILISLATFGPFLSFYWAPAAEGRELRGRTTTIISFYEIIIAPTDGLKHACIKDRPFVTIGRIHADEGL